MAEEKPLLSPCQNISGFAIDPQSFNLNNPYFEMVLSGAIYYFHGFSGNKKEMIKQINLNFNGKKKKTMLKKICMLMERCNRMTVKYLNKCEKSSNPRIKKIYEMYKRHTIN